MPNNFLSELCLAFQMHEGWFPGSRSYRNRSPGNLRINASIAQIYGASSDAEGFAVFKNYDIGFRALADDVLAKIQGRSKHIDYAKNPTFLDMLRVYAPTADHNSPEQYCNALCARLSRYNVKPDTPLSVLSQLIDGKIDRIPDSTPDPAPVLGLVDAPANARKRGEERLLRGLKGKALERAKERLKKKNSP